MEILVTDFVAGARAARGIAVVIDVFRAFSLAAYAFARDVRQIYPVAAVEDARELKRQHQDWLLVGERRARPLPGFDAGNSPTELEALRLEGRTLIHTTHSGTQGLTSVHLADEVLTGALVNADAVVRYVRSRSPACVTLVRMGHEARERCAEDDACAELLRQRLQGSSSLPPADEQAAVRERLRAAPSAVKFFDPACDWAPERDFELCTALDAFDFVLRRETEHGRQVLRRIDVAREVP